jgi:hypothetical protein
VRTGLYIPQRAIIEKNLLGSITTDAWLLLDYLRRWVTCKNLKKVQVEGREFFWIKYRQACRELPILFPRRPILRTQINKMVQLVASLKECGLIESVRFGSRSYIHITEVAQELYARPRIETESHVDGHSVTFINEGHDLEKYDGPVMRNRDDKCAVYIEEQYREELDNTQNNYCDDELESVKRRLEAIFPMRKWSTTEMALLRRQMPIPEWELKLITRFYSLAGPDNPFGTGKELGFHQFLLARRRQTMKILLEHWSDEVTRGLSFFFKTAVGGKKAEIHGWDLTEMRGNGES